MKIILKEVVYPNLRHRKIVKYLSKINMQNYGLRPCMVTRIFTQISKKFVCLQLQGIIQDN